jgi:hypothetical protein
VRYPSPAVEDHIRGVAAQPTPFTLIAGNSVGTSAFGLTTGGL